MPFPLEPSQEDVRKQALLALTAHFVKQGHPTQYAPQMAAASIFQADLELRNAQFGRLLVWLREQHPDLYQEAVTLSESVRQEFEKRVKADY
ncbi:MAG: hypothetical protein ICV77_04250 [Cyanobacteria bacterium Co-bin8]|nr:hypothetical protein [Cyanobacteria bacterium Co-bin8]